jgi:hypothetical protein
MPPPLANAATPCQCRHPLLMPPTTTSSCHVIPRIDCESICARCVLSPPASRHALRQRRPLAANVTAHHHQRCRPLLIPCCCHVILCADYVSEYLSIRDVLSLLTSRHAVHQRRPLAANATAHHHRRCRPLLIPRCCHVIPRADYVSEYLSIRDVLSLLTSRHALRQRRPLATNATAHC